jgi:hypothetical protein
MPIGTSIHFDPAGVRTVIVDDVELEPEPGSFVTALAKREGWPLVAERQAS